MLRSTLRARTPRPLAVGLAAAALGLGLVLSGCGGGESAPTAEEPPASSAPADPTAGQSTEPSTAPSSDAPGEEESGEEQSGDPDGEKPSVEEVAAGVQDSIGEMVPIPDAGGDILGQLTTCAVEEIYDEASAESLQAMADGQLAEADVDDINALSDAISQCSEEITPG